MEQPRNEHGEFVKRESQEEKRQRKLRESKTHKEFCELRAPSKQTQGNPYYSPLYGHYLF
jgi:hypothetical protein